MTDPLPDIWLVRHGATEWTATRRHTGRTDLPLTDDGRAEAAALYRPLDRQRFAAAFTSPLVRARDTARIAGFADAEVLDDLREWDYGIYEGRTTAEIREEIPRWSVWADPVVDGEALADVATRARRVLEHCAAVDGRVVLFAHAHILRILTACALGLDPATGRVLALDAGSISVIGHEHDVRALTRWNWRP
ncbi:MAG: histidine phosphatase family protein [Acidimicrobiia bacterium]